MNVNKIKKGEYHFDYKHAKDISDPKLVNWIEQVKIAENSIMTWKKYKLLVEEITNSQPIKSLHNYKKRSFHDKYGYQLDHIVSVFDGFRHNIPPEMIGDISNLRIITRKENLLKNRKSPPDKLKDMIDKNSEYSSDMCQEIAH